jgi:Abnormal spindle-like microcephaly-assoc'd, ASPM-SPD-2-Hydin/Protein of unknown function (DUF1573)
MRRPPSSRNSAISLRTPATALVLFILILFALIFLVGCQGISSVGSSSSQTTTGLSLGTGIVNFGNVAVGGSSTATFNATNSGAASLTISSVAISSKYFAVTALNLPLTVAPGETTAISIKFTPNAPGVFNATAAVTSSAATTPTNVQLSGTGVAEAQLTPNPTSEAFGSIMVGVQQSQTVILTNSTAASINISQAAVSGAGFQLSGITTPLTLSASQSTTFTVTFAPSSPGNASGSVTITSNAPNPSLVIALSGTAIAPGALGPNPPSLSFGNVQVGANQVLPDTITNTGGSSVTISQVAISGAGFTLSGITAPVTLAAGQSATFNVTFTPQSSGNVSGNITISSTATNSVLTIPLSGTGTAGGALGANPTSLSFGNVQVGSQQSLSETVTNTGGASVTISQVGITGTGFTISGIKAPVTLAAGQSATFTVTFTPPSAGTASGMVTITSNGTNPTLIIPLSGTGVAPGTLTSNPTSLSFGSVTVGSNQSLSETVTNTGGASVTISQVAISGTGFSLSVISTPVTLTAGQSFALTVTFTPASAGSVSGNVTITSTASNPTLIIPLSGSGTATTGQLGVNPTTLGVGSVVVGTSGSASGTLTASSANVMVTAASTSNSVFSVSGLSLPVTIPAGQSVPFTVTFSPQTTGAVTATLTFTSNAQPPTTIETLTGTGTPAPTHTVNLSWTASASPNISGYNVYRAVYVSSCGGFSKINSALVTGTLYADSAVTDGTSYCYASTAVDSSNEESGYSNIASNVQIPAP